MTILIDTGILYAVFDRSDIHHLDSLAILTHSLEGKFGRPYTTDYVVLESTTLLRQRGGGKIAGAFLRMLRNSGITVIVVDEGLYAGAMDLFERDTERMSLCDAASLVIIEKLGIGRLATFDERSFSVLVKEFVGRAYFQALTEEEKGRLRRLIDRARAGSRFR